MTEPNAPSDLAEKLYKTAYGFPREYKPEGLQAIDALLAPWKAGYTATVLQLTKERDDLKAESRHHLKMYKVAVKERDELRAEATRWRELYEGHVEIAGRLGEEVQRLRDAIQKHQDGYAVASDNDIELWAALDSEGTHD